MLAVIARDLRRLWKLPMLAVVSAFIVAASFATASAADKTEKVKIREIDDQDWTIDFVTESGGETLQLELIRKTKISIGDREAGRSNLQEGQTAIIAYDPELSVVTRIDAAPYEAPKGQIDLFNGNDLDGWKFVIPPKVWQGLRQRDCWDVNAERKVLIAKGSGSTWLATESTFDNFDLTCEWRFIPDGPLGGNGSGIVIRAAGLYSNEVDPRGIEIEISESKSGDFITYGTPLANSKRKIAGEAQQRLERLSVPEIKPIGKWNRTEIRCDEDKITVKVNGKLANEATGARVKKGEICLRSQHTAVEFRKIRLTPIAASPEGK